MSDNQQPCVNIQQLGNVASQVHARAFSSQIRYRQEDTVGGTSSKALDIVEFLEGPHNDNLRFPNNDSEMIPSSGVTEEDLRVDVVKISQGRPQEDEGFEYPDGAQRLRRHSDGKYRKIIDLVGDPHALASAFEHLKRNLGKSKIFRPQESIDWRWCEQTADELRAGTYIYHPVRLVNIPVLGESEKVRSVTVINPRDQIILEAFRAVLEQIFAPSFSASSFNCKHTAFESVKYGWKGTSWFMDFNVQKSYDNTTEKRLKRILSEKIQDQRFLDTLTQMFNAGLISMGSGGVEEGGILSSILCNIFFQKLDDEVDQIKKEWDTQAKSRMINPSYRRLMFTDKRTMGRLRGNADQLRRENRHRLSMARKLRISRLDYKDSNYIKVKYVRVGDDFLIGVSGSKSTALNILKRVTTFLKSNLGLQIDMEKTRISHAISDKLLFMGAYVRVLDPKDMPEVSSGFTRAMTKKREQSMRVKTQLEDRWMRECRNVVLKCWSTAFEKWRRELGKDGAKRRTVEVASQQLLSIPEEETMQWREKTQDTLQIFISAALRQGLFPKEELQIYHKILDSLQKNLAAPSELDFGREDAKGY